MMSSAHGSESRAEARPGRISLTYSLADQSFARTKSVGIFNVSLDLLRALARRPELAPMTVLANSSIREKLDLPAATRVGIHDAAVRGTLGRMWWDQFGAYAAARRSGNEWLLLPKGFASFARRRPARLALFIHDVMQDHYDRNYPSAVPELEAAYFRACLRASVRQAEIIFTPTEFTRREVERVACEKGWRVPRLICCGEGFDRPAPPPSAERRDVVVLAGRFPHKLTRLAVEYMSRSQRENLLEESVHWVGSFPQEVDLPGLPGWQRRPRLPEAEFRALMGRARVVVFMSDYEGFGRPPVEAVLAGACPVYSDIPATREVMGGRGCPFDNADYLSFAAALRQAKAAPSAQLRVWADELLAVHNWNAVAGRVVDALSRSRI
jgi:glycosyltransferase involved in cell wall biosynthesis